MSAKELVLSNCGAGEDFGGVPQTPRRSNQSLLREINSEYSLEGLMLKSPILWQPDEKSWLTGKDSDAGTECKQEDKGVTEDEMVG